MKNTIENAMAIAEKARPMVEKNNPTLNNTIVDDYLVKWDMGRKMIFVTMGKYVYCGHITEDFSFVRWSRERA